MAIYNFSDPEFKVPALSQTNEPAILSKKDRFFSTAATRLFFGLLLLADLLWVGYALLYIAAFATVLLITGGKAGKSSLEKGWMTLKRSLVCAVSLFLGLFSPAFGIMIACTYFLMYDQTGIEEVVPSSLRSQFKEFLPKE